MSQSILVPAALIALGGAAVAVQAPLNGALGRSLASPVAAAAVSFAVGFVLLAAMALAGSGGGLARLGSVPLWQLVGGVLGAFYVWAMITAVGSLGAVTAIAALIFGQLTAALILDHAGAFGLVVQPISVRRVAAVALVMAGLILSQS